MPSRSFTAEQLNNAFGSNNIKLGDAGVNWIEGPGGQIASVQRPTLDRGMRWFRIMTPMQVQDFLGFEGGDKFGGLMHMQDLDVCGAWCTELKPKIKTSKSDNTYVRYGVNQDKKRKGKSYNPDDSVQFVIIPGVPAWATEALRSGNESDPYYPCANSFYGENNYSDDNCTETPRNRNWAYAWNNIMPCYYNESVGAWMSLYQHRWTMVAEADEVVKSEDMGQFKPLVAVDPAVGNGSILDYHKREWDYRHASEVLGKSEITGLPLGDNVPQKIFAMNPSGTSIKSGERVLIHMDSNSMMTAIKLDGESELWCGHSCKCVLQSDQESCCVYRGWVKRLSSAEDALDDLCKPKTYSERAFFIGPPNLPDNWTDWVRDLKEEICVEWVINQSDVPQANRIRRETLPVYEICYWPVSGCPTPGANVRVALSAPLACKDSAGEAEKCSVMYDMGEKDAIWPGTDDADGPANAWLKPERCKWPWYSVTNNPQPGDSVGNFWEASWQVTSIQVKPAYVRTATIYYKFESQVTEGIGSSSTTTTIQSGLFSIEYDLYFLVDPVNFEAHSVYFRVEPEHGYGDGPDCGTNGPNPCTGAGPWPNKFEPFTSPQDAINKATSNPMNNGVNPYYDWEANCDGPVNTPTNVRCQVDENGEITDARCECEDLTISPCNVGQLNCCIHPDKLDGMQARVTHVEIGPVNAIEGWRGQEPYRSGVDGDGDCYPPTYVHEYDTETTTRMFGVNFGCEEGFDSEGIAVLSFRANVAELIHPLSRRYGPGGLYNDDNPFNDDYPNKGIIAFADTNEPGNAYQVCENEYIIPEIDWSGLGRKFACDPCNCNGTTYPGEANCPEGEPRPPGCSGGCSEVFDIVFTGAEEEPSGVELSFPENPNGEDCLGPNDWENVIKKAASWIYEGSIPVSIEELHAVGVLAGPDPYQRHQGFPGCCYEKYFEDPPNMDENGVIVLPESPCNCVFPELTISWLEDNKGNAQIPLSPFSELSSEDRKLDQNCDTKDGIPEYDAG